MKWPKIGQKQTESGEGSSEKKGRQKRKFKKLSGKLRKTREAHLWKSNFLIVEVWVVRNYFGEEKDRRRLAKGN